MRCITVAKFIETEGRMVVARGERNGELLFYRISVLRMKSSGDGLYNIVSRFNNTELYT